MLSALLWAVTLPKNTCTAGDSHPPLLKSQETAAPCPPTAALPATCSWGDIPGRSQGSPVQRINLLVHEINVVFLLMLQLVQGDGGEGRELPPEHHLWEGTAPGSAAGLSRQAQNSGSSPRPQRCASLSCHLPQALSPAVSRATGHLINPPAKRGLAQPGLWSLNDARKPFWSVLLPHLFPE